MTRPFLLLGLSFLCACGTTQEKEPGAAPPPGNAEVTAADLPQGNLFRTSRSAGFEAMCKELLKADVVYIGEPAATGAARALELQMLRQLHAGTRLDAIGLAAFPRSDQSALDDYTRARTDWAQLVEQLAGRDLEEFRTIFEFAREHRLGIVALGIDADLLAALQSGGREGLTKAQRDSLPAASESPEGYDAYIAESGAAADRRVRDEVIADSVVRWMRASPPQAQIAVIAERDRVAHAWGLAARVRARGGRSHASVVVLDKEPTPAEFAQSYADFIFVAGE